MRERASSQEVSGEGRHFEIGLCALRVVSVGAYYDDGGVLGSRVDRVQPESSASEEAVGTPYEVGGNAPKLNVGLLRQGKIEHNKVQ